MKNPVVILGAGLTGLSTAYHLNTNYHIFEKENEVGGLCRSHTVSGFTFDYTGHLLFLKNPIVKKFVSDLLRNNLIRHERQSFVCLKNQFIPYPFQANFGLLANYIDKECLGDFIYACGVNQKSKNFSDWLKNTFGNGLSKYFFEPYNKKMWTVPLSQITLDWVQKFIPQPKLDEVIDGVLGNRENKFGYNVEFWYPEKGGILSLPLAIKKGIKNLHLNQSAAEISLKNRIVRFRSKQEIKYSKLVSTLPLPELLKIASDLPSEIKSKGEQLSYCSIFNINLGVKKKVYPDIHWIYFPEKKYPFYRFGFGSNFSNLTAPLNKSSIYIEVSYSSQKPIDKTKVVKDSIDRLIGLKVISDVNDINVLKILDIKYGYVIYNETRKRYLKDILDYLQGYGIYSCGRYGSWEYSSMNDAIITGMEVAKKINLPRTS